MLPVHETEVIPKDEHLRGLKHPAIKPYLAWKKIQKNISTYGEKWLSAIGEDGRLRARVDTLGTVTGRTSCAKPNLQNMPRETPHRRCIEIGRASCRERV